MKTCSKCKTEKHETDFAKHSRSKDGLQCWCRECKAAQHKDTYSPEKRKKWAADNREKIRERRKHYYQRTKEHQIARSKKWHQAHPERVREHKRRHAAKHPGRDLARLQKYISDNPARKNMGRKELRDKYVASVMTRRAPDLRKEDIPQDLIAAKKVQLQIRRLLKGQI